MVRAYAQEQATVEAALGKRRAVQRADLAGKAFEALYALLRRADGLDQYEGTAAPIAPFLSTTEIRDEIRKAFA